MAPAPLSARTYVARNLRRVAPVLAIQALVTCLLVAAITPTNAFRATTEAYTAAMAHMTIVTPRERPLLDGALRGLLDQNPHQERRQAAKMFWVRTPMIVGEAWAPLLLLPPPAQQDLLARTGCRLVEGRMPEPGSAGVAVHEAVLRARGWALGSAFGEEVDRLDSTPGRFEVVGVLAGPARLAVGDLERASQPDSVYARQLPFEVVYARPGAEQASDAWLQAARLPSGGLAFRVVDDDLVRARIEQAFVNLPLVLGFITAAVAVVVALVTALLDLLQFQARLDELALLLAVGHPRRRLMQKLAAEGLLVALLGWALGLLLGLGAVATYRALVLEPRGILMHLLDARPLAASLAVPLLATAVGALALRARIRRMDPVAVLQRRGA
ncbi:MAG: FtsX-like permease family protein [Planctomycetia bacterium]